jgi:hypothetical protein
MFSEIRLWLIGAAIVTAWGSVAAWTHSIKSSAAAVATHQCNEDKLAAANKLMSLALDAEMKARALADARVAARDEELENARAALNQIEEQNAALRAKAPDRDVVVFSADDSWLQSRRKIRDGAGAHRPVPSAVPSNKN